VSTQQLFQSIQNSDIAIAMGQSNHLFGVLAQLFHIAGLIFILASILLVNLRLLGVGLIQQTSAELVKATNPYVWTGLVFLILSGLFMFAPSAALYYPNPAFWFKLQVFAVALLVQFTLYRKITTTESPNRALATITAISSLTLWFTVGLAGRAIGFMAA
jgi:hypothetical protein